MRKSLTTICAVLLVAGLAACNRGSGNGSDEDRLNAAARTLDDNGVYDTSADDAALNQAELPADQAGPGNAAGANAAAPGNASATGNATTNRQ
jgi:hypothetical protein